VLGLDRLTVDRVRHQVGEKLHHVAPPVQSLDQSGTPARRPDGHGIAKLHRRSPFVPIPHRRVRARLSFVPLDGCRVTHSGVLGIEAKLTPGSSLP
jgi:hypothetical protein